MAYSEVARVTENTQRITTTGSVQTAVRSAINTFGEAIDATFSTYSLNEQDQQAVRDMIVNICRTVDHSMQ